MSGEESDDEMVTFGETTPKGGKIKISSKDSYKKIRSSDLVHFIQLVEQNEHIWRITSPKYKDVSVVNLTWADIERNCDYLYCNKGYAAKRVWMTLLTDFRKEKMRLSQTKSGSSPVQRQFAFLEEMAFLNENAASKLPEKMPIGSSSSSVRVDLGFDKKRKSQQFHEEPETTPKRKAKKAEPETGLNEVMSYCLKELKKCSEAEEESKAASQHQAHQDIIDKVLNTLNKIPNSSHLNLKFKISQVCDQFDCQFSPTPALYPNFMTLD